MRVDNLERERVSLSCRRFRDPQHNGRVTYESGRTHAGEHTVHGTVGRAADGNGWYSTRHSRHGNRHSTRLKAMLSLVRQGVNREYGGHTVQDKDDSRGSWTSEEKYT